MKKYHVYVPETWLTRFEVEAESEDAAVQVILDEKAYLQDQKQYFDQGYFEWTDFAPTETWYAEEIKGTQCDASK